MLSNETFVERIAWFLPAMPDQIGCRKPTLLLRLIPTAGFYHCPDRNFTKGYTGIFFVDLKRVTYAKIKDMGKKKKSFYKKELKPLFKGNKVLFAALGGAAAGIAIANIFGTEKASQILKTVEDSVAEASDRISNGFKSFKNGNAEPEARSRETVHN
jgi:hypothetical protein